MKTFLSVKSIYGKSILKCPCGAISLCLLGIDDFVENELSFKFFKAACIVAQISVQLVHLQLNLSVFQILADRNMLYSFLIFQMQPRESYFKFTNNLQPREMFRDCTLLGLKILFVVLICGLRKLCLCVLLMLC